MAAGAKLLGGSAGAGSGGGGCRDGGAAFPDQRVVYLQGAVRRRRTGEVSARGAVTIRVSLRGRRELRWRPALRSAGPHAGGLAGLVIGRGRVAAFLGAASSFVKRSSTTSFIYTMDVLRAILQPTENDMATPPFTDYLCIRICDGHRSKAGPRCNAYERT